MICDTCGARITFWQRMMRTHECIAVNKLIDSLRGDKFPRQCDWCERMLTRYEAIPISGGEWVCAPCCNVIISRGTIEYLKGTRGIDDQRRAGDSDPA